MNYQECKFRMGYNRCSHKDAPEPYRSQCLGKEQCLAWNDPITDRALDIGSPIQNAAQELFEVAKIALDLVKSVLHEHPDDAIAQVQKGVIEKALAKAEGREK